MRVLLADFLFFHFHEGSQGALEFSALLIGFLLGVLYVFDGWKRPLKVSAFKDSYRLAGLLFIVAGAGTTLIGDLRMFNRNTDPERWPVIACYVGGVFSGGAVALAVLVIGFSLWWLYCRLFNRSSDPDLAVMPGLLLVSNGVEATINKWEEAVATKRKEQGEAQSRFFRAYVDHLSKAFAATELSHDSGVSFLRDNPRAAIFNSRGDAILVVVLEAMVMAVQEYCRSLGRGTDARFYANFLRLVDAAPVRKDIRFSVGNPEHYKRALVLEAQNWDKHPLGFTLGVEEPGAEKSALPGAPTAVLLGKTVAVPDVAKGLGGGSGLTREFKAKVKEHLLGIETKSFFCFPVAGTVSNPRPRRVVLGAVVVECSEPGVLEVHSTDQPSLFDLVQPFRLVLAWAAENRPAVSPKALLSEASPVVDPKVPL